VTFEFTTEVRIRYDDFDTYGHVNNARYGTYLEEARIDYLADVVGDGDRTVLTGSETGIVVANLELSFEQPVSATDSVTVGVRVPDLSTTSAPIEYEVRDDGRVAATGETTVVTYDPEAREPRPIPDAWRAAIREFEGL